MDKELSSRVRAFADQIDSKAPGSSGVIFVSADGIDYCFGCDMPADTLHEEIIRSLLRTVGNVLVAREYDHHSALCDAAEDNGKT